MTTELATKARAALSLSADVLDDQLDDAVAEKAIALSADLATAKSNLAAAISERDAAKADATAKANQVLSLSASAPKELDATTSHLITRAFKTERDQVIASGVISEAGMKELDALMFSDGKPVQAALRCPPARSIRSIPGSVTCSVAIRVSRAATPSNAARPPSPCSRAAQTRQPSPRSNRSTPNASGMG